MLQELEPKGVFHFFEELCSIPHGSGNTKKISDWCVDFARARGLWYQQDASNNVIIKKPASPGLEGLEPVIIQGHLDMVCEKELGCAVNFLKDGLELQVDGDWVSARGTTLGGDDGIAVAMALAVLDDDSIPHGSIEAVFTVDEEVGMLGATALDTSCLEGKYLLNIDSEVEGVFTVSCAGGVRCDGSLKAAREPIEGLAVTVKLGGLTGGHSGVEIDKGRGNGNLIMGGALRDLLKGETIHLVSLRGGSADNAIPNECTAEVIVCDNMYGALQDRVQFLEERLREEQHKVDPNLTFTCTAGEERTDMCVTDEDTNRILAILTSVPDGVQKMSGDMAGLVQTSLNLGIMELNGDEFKCCFSLRSSVDSEKKSLARRLEDIFEEQGGTVEFHGDYPGWAYRPASKLRDTAVDVYCAQYGSLPEVTAIHAGLECGIFVGKMPGLDCISFGPDLEEIHTVRERMSISSVQRVWKFLLGVLAEL